ncbi:sedoheptulokinase [Ditylenchus destructor]|uniref:Sedoheptulokinase n=1 Tax=Ditylenchus destructor TaxID=166010 RepID=A0AAD4RDS4_9BILA|nr:sedoheptulokinase [Ditylenchus destructor]
MASSSYLGIDIGTTTVKICLVGNDKQILKESSVPHNATISIPTQPLWHEQDPKKILDVVFSTLEEFSELCSSTCLKFIGVSGQMHDIILWQNASLNSNEGYKNLDTDKRFPLHLFPKIVNPGFIVGQTKHNVSKLPSNINVLVSMGDLQTSLFPVIQDDEAVIHIGTSSQISFLPRIPIHTNAYPGLQKFPFFNNKCLSVAASLNGGNCLDTFVEHITACCRFLFQNTPELHLKTDIFKEILGKPSESSTGLLVTPLFRGERHSPEIGASLQNWTAGTTPIEFAQSIARGVIVNLAAMLPDDLLSKHHINSVRLLNRATEFVYLEEAKKCYSSKKIIVDNSSSLSAAYGSALFCASL